MASQQIPILSPSKGVVRAVPREGQPQDTCWDAMNMLPWDRYGRKRLAQRPGIQKQFTQYAGNGTQFIQGMIEAPNIIYPPGVFTAVIGGLTEIPGYTGTFNAPGTTGPLAGPAIPGPFPFGWTWVFRVGVNYTNPIISTGGANLIARFTFPTWLDLSGGLPGVLKGMIVGIKIGLVGGDGYQTSCNVRIGEGVVAAPPAYASLSTAAFLSPPPNQDAASTLWTFSVAVTQTGGVTITDFTDTVTTNGSLAVSPQMNLAPSLHDAIVTDPSSVVSGNAAFFILDS